MTASGNGDEGIVADKIRGQRFTASANASVGIAGGDVRLAGVTADGNGLATGASGITASTARLEEVHATGNSGAGVEAYLSLRIENAVLTGNEEAGLGIDLVCGTFPTVAATTCGLSSDTPFR